MVFDLFFLLRDSENDLNLEHVLKRSSVNSIVAAKFDKCGKNKHDVFSSKVSNAQEDAEFMKWIFVFAIIKLRLQLRYLAYEQKFKT